MRRIKLSLCIPYKQRLSNLRVVFDGLAAQTMEHCEFEVIVGAMEYASDYVALCQEFRDKLDIVSVLSTRPFQISHARNLAMRQAVGDICIQMDADTLLTSDALQKIYERHFAFGQNQCVVGQVVGYGNNTEGDVGTCGTRSYRHYREELEALARSTGRPSDPRFQVPHVIPWSLAWTGLIALPLQTIRLHSLFFDESFCGWGVDDLEWGYRICAAGIPITLKEDIRALHLTHARDATSNRRTERDNYRRFLRKWPRTDVEIANAFGDVGANTVFVELCSELKRITGSDKYVLGTLRGTIDGRSVLLVGIPLDAKRRLLDTSILSLVDNTDEVEILPLVGLALPYEDATVSECRMFQSISRFSPKYREAIYAEGKRVGKVVSVATMPSLPKHSV